jgi:hypothetical protein
MKLTFRDAIASLLIVGIAVPYVGFLVNDEMPFIQDARGMAAVGLVLGSIAFLVLQSGNADDRVGAGEGVAAIVSMSLGLAALLLAETAAAEILLAVFMASILLVYAFEVADHAGLVHAHAGPHAR